MVFIISSFSLVQSESVLTSLQSLRTWIVVLLFASLSAAALNKHKALEWMIKILVLFSAFLSIVSLVLNIFNFPNPYMEINLIFPSFGHIRFAEFFLPLLPTSILYAVDNKKSKLIRISSMVSIIFLFLTFSRSSWLVILIAPILLPFYLGGKVIRGVIKQFVALSIVVLVLMGLLIKVWSGIKYVAPNSYRILNIVMKPLDLDTRVEYYRFSIKKFLDSSILGHGPGTFYFPKSNMYSGASSTIMAHNHFFQKVYEIGYVGAIIYFTTLFYLYRLAFMSTKGDATGRLVLMGVALSFIQSQMDFGWEIPIVYLINVLFIFAYQPRDIKKSDIPSKVSHVLFATVIIWTLVSGISDKSTSEKYNKLIKREVTNNFKSSPLVKQWIALDRGNGRTYISLSGKEFIVGNYQDSVDFLFKSVNSSMYQDVVSQKYLLRFLADPAINRITDQSVFKVLNIIDQSSYPHNFFWVNSLEDQKTIFLAIDKLISNKNISESLTASEIAKIYYWKFTQVFTSTNYQIESYVQYIDHALRIESGNAEYLQISNISHGIIENKESDSLLKEINTELKKYPRKDIYISLGDLVYSNLSKYIESTGNLDKELEIRRLRIDFSHYGSSYISYAKRLSNLGLNNESEKILSECIVLYPDCKIWYKSAL